MQLKRLKLTNYRNIKEVEYIFNGNSFIVGDNKIGKTNTLEAISFLLDSSNTSADIIPNDNESAVVRVDAVFDDFIIAKEYYNDIKEVRGTGVFENKGRITKYYINGERVESAKEFNSFVYKKLNVQNKIGLNVIKLLSDPFYIGNLCQTGEWKKVREFLFSNLATATPHEKIAEDLKECDTDALKKKYNAKIKEFENIIERQTVAIETLEKTKSLIVWNKELREYSETIESERMINQMSIIDYESKLEYLNSYLLELVKSIKSVGWQLVETTLKGEEKETCEPYIIGTDILWHNGSKSEQIITGIAIAESIKQKLGLCDLPYLFDEGGEISETTMKEKIKTKAQIICVKVKDGIKTPLIEPIR